MTVGHTDDRLNQSDYQSESCITPSTGRSMWKTILFKALSFCFYSRLPSKNTQLMGCQQNVTPVPSILLFGNGVHGNRPLDFLIDQSESSKQPSCVITCNKHLQCLLQDIRKCQPISKSIFNSGTSFIDVNLVVNSGSRTPLL